jgi:hypothetical protein
MFVDTHTVETPAALEFVLPVESGKVRARSAAYVHIQRVGVSP